MFLMRLTLRGCRTWCEGDDAGRYRWFSGERRGMAFGGYGKNGIGSEISAMERRKRFAFIRGVDMELVWEAGQG